MAKRKYSIEQVRKFLKIYYNIEWWEGIVFDKNLGSQHISPEMINEDELVADIAIVKQDGDLGSTSIHVTNQIFKVKDSNCDHSDKWNNIINNTQKSTRTKRKYTLQDVSTFIQEYLGFKWVDRLLYNSNKGTYYRAQEKDLNKDELTMYIQNVLSGQAFLFLVEITEDVFELKRQGLKISATEAWHEYLGCNTNPNIKIDD